MYRAAWVFKVLWWWLLPPSPIIFLFILISWALSLLTHWIRAHCASHCANLMALLHRKFSEPRVQIYFACFVLSQHWLWTPDPLDSTSQVLEYVPLLLVSGLVCTTSTLHMTNPSWMSDWRNNQMDERTEWDIAESLRKEHRWWASVSQYMIGWTLEVFIRMQRWGVRKTF